MKSQALAQQRTDLRTISPGRVPVRSRADLLLLREDPGGLTPSAAALVGFLWEETPALLPQLPKRDDVGLGQSHKSEPLPALEFPREIPRLHFCQAWNATTFSTENVPPQPPRPPPIRDEELVADWSREVLPPSLVPWTRLVPFLRERLGSVVSGRRLDLRRLLRQIGRGEALRSVPRRPRRIWAPQALVLWDDTTEMDPFMPDVRSLVQRLRRERGRAGLKVEKLPVTPSCTVLPRLPAKAPVLAVSTLGAYPAGDELLTAWRRLGRELQWRGHLTSALAPVPLARWPRERAGHWFFAVWDRQPRLPRLGQVPAATPRAGRSAAMERLLALVSPATRIEHFLLRSVRLLLGRAADVGTEWEVWHHADCWQGGGACGLSDGAPRAQWLDRRKALASTEPALVAAADALLKCQHSQFSPLLAAEAELRACLSATGDAAVLERVGYVFTRVLERLRQLSIAPGSRVGKATGLAAWFERMVARLPPSMRTAPSVADVIARGLAQAKFFQQASRVEWPIGINEAAAVVELRGAGRGGEVRDLRAVLRGNHLVIQPASLSTGAECLPLALLQTSRPLVHWRPVRGGGASAEITVLGTALAPDLVAPGAFALETDRQHIDFRPVRRPEWAEQMYQDRFGLALEFQVNGVAFVMRWIPPGRFLMGSPETEVARHKDEGPQHEVTISRGFWLGETPVTQAQWAAVVGPGVGTGFWSQLLQTLPNWRTLDLKPSRFKGESLPVESVSFWDVRAWIFRLGVWAESSPFRLPTEAEWEYACRAGSEGAYNDRSACTVPSGKDPALDRLGWFDDNSGLTTHPVKQKYMNAWGLYDLHGNVLEWCADGQRDYRDKSEKDPKGPEGNSARVVRGGAWFDRAQDCRTARRPASEVGVRGLNLGFRLAAGQELTESVHVRGNATIEVRDSLELRVARSRALPS